MAKPEDKPIPIVIPEDKPIPIIPVEIPDPAAKSEEKPDSAAEPKKEKTGSATVSGDTPGPAASKDSTGPPFPLDYIPQPSKKPKLGKEKRIITSKKHDDIATRTTWPGLVFIDDEPFIQLLGNAGFTKFVEEQLKNIEERAFLRNDSMTTKAIHRLMINYELLRYLDASSITQPYLYRYSTAAEKLTDKEISKILSDFMNKRKGTKIPYPITSMTTIAPPTLKEAQRVRAGLYQYMEKNNKTEFNLAAQAEAETNDNTFTGGGINTMLNDLANLLFKIIEIQYNGYDELDVESQFSYDLLRSNYPLMSKYTPTDTSLTDEEKETRRVSNISKMLEDGNITDNQIKEYLSID